MPSIPPLKTSGIYQIICVPTGKFYIGSSQDIHTRWHQHLWALRRNQHHSTLLQRAWAKYGVDAFTVAVLEECDLESLITREQHYLDTLRPHNPEIGFNIAIDAAVSTRGLPVSDERRAAVSAKLRGRIVSPETRAKLSASRSGKSMAYLHTPEMRKKNGDARRGRPMKAETKEALRLAKIGKPRSAETRAKLVEAHRRRREGR